MKTATMKRAPSRTSIRPPSHHAIPALPDLIPDLLDLAHDAFIVTSVTGGTVSYWSRAATAIYGWTAREAAGRRINELLGTVFPVAEADIQRRTLETGLWEGELIQSTKSGQTIVVRSRWAPRRDSHGNVLALLRINRDITAEKVIHDALARSEFQFRYMVENADEGIVQTSPTGSILFANQRFTDLLGIPFHGVVGRSIFEFTDEAGYHLVKGQPKRPAVVFA
ncbi:MAG: PAS domain-containing protein, partial [Chloroflexota bacterium]